MILVLWLFKRRPSMTIFNVIAETILACAYTFTLDGFIHTLYWGEPGVIKFWGRGENISVG